MASSFAFTAEGITKIALCANITYVDLKEEQTVSEHYPKKHWKHVVLISKTHKR